MGGWDHPAPMVQIPPERDDRAAAWPYRFAVSIVCAVLATAADVDRIVHVGRVGRVVHGEETATATPLPEVAAVRDTDGVFLPSADERRLWERTVAIVSADWPIERAVEPDFRAVPPEPGIIESAWIEPPGTAQSGGTLSWPPKRQRVVVRVVPAAGGAWIEGVVETQSLAGEPNRDKDSLPLDAVTGIAPVGFWGAEVVDETASRRVTASIAARMAPPEGTVYALPPLDSHPAVVPEMPWAHSRHPRMSRAWHYVAEDYHNFYSCESLTCLAGAFGAGALMANTGFDETMQQAWQKSVAPTDLGTFFHDCKNMGEGRYALPVFGIAALTGYVFEGRPAGDLIGAWGARSLRMFVVGAPPLYVLQLATGGSRPSDNASVNSGWKFFQDDNGVSGHAFVGAIPFLAAAGMVENPWAKGGLYVCSTFVAFSRITDDAHYPSQAFLGWYLAFASAMAVNRTDIHFAGMEVQLVPIVVNGGTGVGLETRW